MPTRNTVRNTIAERIGYRTDTSTLTQIVTEMSLVQRTILEDGRLTPWFLRKLDADLTLLVSARTLAIPTDFIVMDSKAGFWHYLSTAGADARYVKKLVKDDWDVLINTYQETDGIAPLGYEMDRTNFHIFPKNNSAGSLTFKINYYARETDVADGDIENDWLVFAEDLMIAEVGFRMAKRLRDTALQAEFTSEIGEARTRLSASEVEREMSDNDHQMGGED